MKIPRALVGIEAEAKVCCSEETTLIHRRRQLAAERLPVGRPELVGSLLVQVRTSHTPCWFGGIVTGTLFERPFVSILF